MARLGTFVAAAKLQGWRRRSLPTAGVSVNALGALTAIVEMDEHFAA